MYQKNLQRFNPVNCKDVKALIGGDSSGRAQR